VESLVIHAASRESAEGFSSALSGLHPRLVEGEEGRIRVEIPLGGGNRQVLQALRMLEAYVSARGDGPARLDLGDQHYTLHPTDAA
jgi:hypothetical protein